MNSQALHDLCVRWLMMYYHASVYYSEALSWAGKHYSPGLWWYLVALQGSSHISLSIYQRDYEQTCYPFVTPMCLAWTLAQRANEHSSTLPATFSKEHRIIAKWPAFRWTYQENRHKLVQDYQSRTSLACRISKCHLGCNMYEVRICYRTARLYLSHSQQWNVYHGHNI